MPIKVPDDFVKIKMDEKGRHLLAYMPDGTKIPCITEINIHSEVGSLVRATITVMADIRDIEQYQELINKEVVVKHTVSNEELLKLINKNKDDVVNG